MTEHRLDLTALAQSLIDGEHSIFSASGSGLWLHCAGGLIPNLLAKDNSGVEAAEGTVAHGCGETWLKVGKKPKHLIGTKQTVKNGGVDYTIEITAEMLNYVQEYVDWCAWLPGQHFTEQKVYYSEYTPLKRQGGTADHVVCSYQRMTITDLKYGKGHMVLAKNNSQALLYALGFFLEWDWLYDFQEIELRICQPRMRNFDVHTVTRQELLEFAEHVKVRAHEAWSLDAPRTPGAKQCQFCRVKSDCGAHFDLQVALTSGGFSAIDEPVTEEDIAVLKDSIDFQEIGAKMLDVYKLTTDELAQVYRYRSLFEGWWKSLHNELNIRAARGEIIRGMKLVEARSRRKIRDQEIAVKALAKYGVTREELIEEEFASPAEIERILRKKGVRPKDLETVLDPLVYKPPGKLTLVSDADKRSAVVDVTEEAFSNLDLETETLDSQETEEI